MKKSYPYIFEKGSKKHICPACGHKRFVRYVDKETGDYLPEQYGKCDRADNCGYFLNPYTDGYVRKLDADDPHNVKMDAKQYARAREKPTKKMVNIPVEVLRKTFNERFYRNNVFLQNLLTNVPYPFDNTDVSKVTGLYYLGTSSYGHNIGAVTFPFIDESSNIRAVQVKQFDSNNKTTHTTFLHKIIEGNYRQSNTPIPKWIREYNEQDSMVSCLFGAHLLNDYKYNAIALVEAPKTAIYGTLYFGFPENTSNLLWLAVYNKSSLNYERLKVLKGRTIIVFPDLSNEGKTFNEWQEKIKLIAEKMPGTKFKMSNLIEKFAPEQDRINGNDIADYLIKLDWRNFRNEVTEIPVEVSNVSNVENEPVKKTIIAEVEREIYSTTQSWNTEILKLETFFENSNLPKQIELSNFEKIFDVRYYVEKCLKRVKANNGNPAYLPYLIYLKSLMVRLNNKVP